MEKYELSIADIRIEIISPREMDFKENIIPFLDKDGMENNSGISVEIIHGLENSISDENCKDVSGGIFLKENQVIQRYQWKKDEYIYRVEQFGRGLPCQIGIPYSFVETFYNNGDILRYLALERLLIRYDRVFLHSSLVLYKGEMYLFAAPSGGGKSTHACLWEHYYDAEIINGDKAVLYEKEGIWYASGSPIAGSSGIYKNVNGPIKAIVFLVKGDINYVSTMPLKEAYLHMYSGLIKSKWDTNYNNKILDIAERITKSVPIWKLSCKPDKDAVDCILQYCRGEYDAEEVET